MAEALNEARTVAAFLISGFGRVQVPPCVELKAKPVILRRVRPASICFVPEHLEAWVLVLSGGNWAVWMLGLLLLTCRRVKDTSQLGSQSRARPRARLDRPRFTVLECPQASSHTGRFQLEAQKYEQTQLMTEA